MRLVDLDLAGATATTLAPAVAGVAAVVCAAGHRGGPLDGAGYGAVDEAGTLALVEAAREAGVQRCVSGWWKGRWAVAWGARAGGPRPPPSRCSRRPRDPHPHTPSTRPASFVLLSSLLANGAAAGQRWNPAFVFLNLFGGVLDHKLAAEQALRASGLDWVVVRPGGLSSEPAANVGGPVVGAEDTLFGLPGDPGRAVARDTVADVLAAAVGIATAGGHVVELVASPDAVQASGEDVLARLA